MFSMGRPHRSQGVGVDDAHLRDGRERQLSSSIHSNRHLVQNVGEPGFSDTLPTTALSEERRGEDSRQARVVC